MEKNELREEWASRVRAFRTSGQTAVEWCAVNNLKIHQLKYWLRRQKSLTAPAVSLPAAKPAAKLSRWLPLEIDALEVKSPPKTLLIKVGFATIEISPGFDPDLLAAAVRALSVSC